MGTDGIVAKEVRLLDSPPCPRLTRADVEHVAQLARLALTDDEIEQFTARARGDPRARGARSRRSTPTTCRPPRTRCRSSTCCAPTRCARASTATRCWPWRRRPRTAGSASRASSTRRERARARARGRGARAATGRAVDVVEEHLAVDRGARAGAARVQPRAPTSRRGRRPTRSTPRSARGEDPGPLAGVPIVLKDNLCTRGVAHHLLVADPRGLAPAVHRDRRASGCVGAGAVPVAKTNLDEFAMGSSTENSAFGPTRNPHDPSRVPGGSSGGSAAAVAAGYAPLGARLRHRRLDPPARGAVRRRRREAHLRPGVALRPRSRSRARSTRSARSPPPSPTPRCCST